MTNSTKRTRDIDELFADLDIDPHEEWLHHKREDAAIVLTGMLLQSGISRADLARKLDWRPSRVSRALSGDENLTINTIAEIVNAAGYDFDLRLRQRGQARAFQPWEAEVQANDKLDLVTTLLGRIEVMHAEAAAMKETWEQRVRSVFRGNRYLQQRQNFAMETISANDDAPLAVNG